MIEFSIGDILFSPRGSLLSNSSGNRFMNIKLHKQTTTIPRIHAAPSSITNSEPARQYSASTATILRWRHRHDVHGQPHTRPNLLATLHPEQKEVLIAVHELLRLSLDDLLIVAREFLEFSFVPPCLTQHAQAAWGADAGRTGTIGCQW